MINAGLKLIPFAAFAALLTGCTTTDAQPGEPGGSGAPTDYVAQFNEPFLTFTTSGGSMVLIAPGVPDGMQAEIFRRPIDGGVQINGVLDQAAPESRFRLTIRKERCQDDMAGFYFSHSARLERGAALELMQFQGCARFKSEPQPRE